MRESGRRQGRRALPFFLPGRPSAAGSPRQAALRLCGPASLRLPARRPPPHLPHAGGSRRPPRPRFLHIPFRPLCAGGPPPDALPVLPALCIPCPPRVAAAVRKSGLPPAGFFGPPFFPLLYGAESAIIKNRRRAAAMPPARARGYIGCRPDGCTNRYPDTRRKVVPCPLCFSPEIRGTVPPSALSPGGRRFFSASACPGNGAAPPPAW